MSRMLFAARGLCQSLPAPAAASPALVPAQGTSRPCCCKEALHSVLLLCNQGFEAIFRYSQLGSRATECPQPVVGQRSSLEKAGCSIPGSEGECSSQSSWPSQQPGHSSGVSDCSCSRTGIPALSSASEIEAPQLWVSGRMRTPAGYLERGWAV